LGGRRIIKKKVAETRGFDGVAVQIAQVLRDAGALGVEPGSLTDAVPSIDPGLTAGRAGAEICVPGAASPARSLSQLLAVLIDAGQAAEVRSFARTGAGDEETHWLGRGFRRLRAGDSQIPQRGQGDHAENTVSL